MNFFGLFWRKSSYICRLCQSNWTQHLGFYVFLLCSARAILLESGPDLSRRFPHFSDRMGGWKWIKSVQGTWGSLLKCLFVSCKEQRRFLLTHCPQAVALSVLLQAEIEARHSWFCWFYWPWKSAQQQGVTTSNNLEMRWNESEYNIDLSSVTNIPN